VVVVVVKGTGKAWLGGGMWVTGLPAPRLRHTLMPILPTPRAQRVPVISFPEYLCPSTALMYVTTAKVPPTADGCEG